eukprot:704292-Pyramimonas_sp.AAC.1
MNWNARCAKWSVGRGSSWRRRRKTRDFGKRNSWKAWRSMPISTFGATSGNKELCSGRKNTESNCDGSRREIA